MCIPVKGLETQFCFTKKTSKSKHDTSLESDFFKKSSILLEMGRLRFKNIIEHGIVFVNLLMFKIGVTTNY